MRPTRIKTGVTRWVVLLGPYAIKIPKSIRGWLGNQSEWKQRNRRRVNRPRITLFHLMLVFPRASWVPNTESQALLVLHDLGAVDEVFDGDESKPDSWGLFRDSQYRLIDFDRAWENPTGFVGRLYYWNQGRLARKWMKLED